MVQTFFIDTKALATEKIDGEIIIVSSVTGQYFALSSSASDVWELILNRVGRDAWIDILNFAYPLTPPELENQLDNILNIFLEQNLISPLDGNGTNTFSLDNSVNRKEWIAPVIDIFNDLTDLLLADPIHDTTESGWPFRENG